MSNELVETTSQSRALAMPTANAMAEVLAEQTKIRQVLKQYIAEAMKADVDFGIIPGTENPTLLDPGADKMAEIFRCTPHYEVTRREEDFESGLFFYEFRCQFVSRDSGAIVSEGWGSCNSFEKKYRWRNAARKCPACGKEAIIKGQEQYGGGWLCWKKKDGCGAKFGDADKKITDQVAGQVINENPADQLNTIMKMAKKRAKVDCAKTMCSRYGFQFSQDMEDMADGQYEPPKPATTEAPAATAGGISKETDERIHVLLEMGKLKWHDPVVVKMVAGVIHPLSPGVGFKSSSLTEAEGRMILNAIAEWDRKQASLILPITEPTKANVLKLLESINKRWDMDNAKFRGWVETVIKHPIGQGVFISDLKEGEGLAIVKELESLIRNTNGRTCNA
jgi:hypothetical protein